MKKSELINDGGIRWWNELPAVVPRAGVPHDFEQSDLEGLSDEALDALTDLDVDAVIAFAGTVR